jgi:hypothetical protein
MLLHRDLLTGAGEGVSRGGWRFDPRNDTRIHHIIMTLFMCLHRRMR